MLWGALGIVVVIIFVVMVWSLRPPSPGIGDAATMAVPTEPAAKPLPDARPVAP